MTKIVMMQVIHIANEGFLVISAAKKILIDALFCKGGPGRASVPSESVLSKMEHAQAPFDNIDLLLVTHRDEDHFDAACIEKHLVSNPQAVLLGPQQVSLALEEYCRDRFPGRRDQLRVLTASPGGDSEITVNGITVKAVAFEHVYSSNPRIDVQHMGYVVDLGKEKCMHIGDAETNKENFRELSRVAGEAVDMAFIPGWFLFEPTGEEILRDYIRARHIAFMHLPLNMAAGNWNYLSGHINKLMLKKDFPRLKIFRESMESWIL